MGRADIVHGPQHRGGGAIPRLHGTRQDSDDQHRGRQAAARQCDGTHGTLPGAGAADHDAPEIAYYGTTGRGLRMRSLATCGRCDPCEGADPKPGPVVCRIANRSWVTKMTL